MTYNPPILRIKNLTMDLSSHEVRVGDAPLALTRKEYLVFEFLMRHRGAVLTKDAIVDYVYGGPSTRDTKVIDIFIWKLRKKLTQAGVGPLIGTAWGKGFIIAERRDDMMA